MARVLLSYGCSDVCVHVEPEWTFHKFRCEIRKLFPNLPQSFVITDSDFSVLGEDGFATIKSTRAETWCLIRKDEKENAVLSKPRYEKLKYDVHPNALTQSGNYHFSACYQAFCEFIDNSLQATRLNRRKGMERTVQIHLYPKEKVAAIWDNGEGMTYDGLRAFATYFLSQADRGLEEIEVKKTPGYLDSHISKFGVGATQAGFYLGNRIKVITKRDDCPFVTEISISKEKLHRRAEQNLPVFEDFRCIRMPSDSSTLELKEEKKCFTDLIEREAAYEQFTMIILTGIRDDHMELLKKDNGQEFSKNLAHVYHFYVHGAEGCAGRMKLPVMENTDEFQFQKADLSVLIDEGKNSRTCIKLRDVVDDLESLIQKRAKDWFPFTLNLKLTTTPEEQEVQGVLMYYPHEGGQETLPMSIEEDVLESSDPMFECFWQGRLAPLSFVRKLDFCAFPAQRKRKQKDILPDMCYKRLKGILFFNRNTPVSNNKLKILLDERKDLSAALEDSIPERKLPHEFKKWLEKCHRNLDKEVSFNDAFPAAQQPKNGDQWFKEAKIVSSKGEQVYKVGDVVKLDTRPFMYGKILHIIKAGQINEVDRVVVQRQPEQVYPKSIEEKSLLRIMSKPDPATLKKIFTTELQMLPKTVKVFKDNPSNILSSEFAWLAGARQKEDKGNWVQVYNGENPAKPITLVQGRKISVKQEVSGPSPLAAIDCVTPIDDKFGFTGFWLTKVGVYTLKYSAILSEKVLCTAEFKITVKPNKAETINLIEPQDDPELPLGEPKLGFKVLFLDEYSNPTDWFTTGNVVKFNVTCPTLQFKGLKDQYKPKDGYVTVSGVSIEPKGKQPPMPGEEHAIDIDVQDIGNVIFPIRIKTGPVHSLVLPPMDDIEVINYEKLSDFSVDILDKWNNPCSMSNEEVKVKRLIAECDAFKQTYFVPIDKGQAHFPSMTVHLQPGQAPVKKTVKISLATVEIVRKKITIKNVIKELAQFSFKVLPSSQPHSIKVYELSQKGYSEKSPGNCLVLKAQAGSVLGGLCIKAFNENGQQLTDEEFRSFEPEVTTTWAGEVPVKKLPNLPDCPLAQMVASVFVGNISCTCLNHSCKTQIRINPLPGDAVKWSFSSNSDVEIQSDEKKLLTQCLRIKAVDKFGNHASPPPNISPLVSIDNSLSTQDSKASFLGELVFKQSINEFVFTADSVVSGIPGTVVLSVQDEGNVCAHDAVKIKLKPGPPYHIRLHSESFESKDVLQEHNLKVFSRCCLRDNLVAYVCDKTGNPTSLKTSLVLSWTPANCGQSLSKKTTAKGEATFASSLIKCQTHSKSVKLKVASTDVPTLKVALVNVTVQQCNHVKSLKLTIMKDSIVAGDSFPNIKVELDTEDGVSVPAGDHTQITLQSPNGEQFDGRKLYKKPVNKGQLLEFIPLANGLAKAAGQWSICATFLEFRADLKKLLPTGEHITRSTPVKFKVVPGEAQKLELECPQSTLTASCTANDKGRIILPKQSGRTVDNVIISTIDAFGNFAPVSCNVQVCIEWPSDSTFPTDIVMPLLEQNANFSLNGEKTRVPKMSLQHRVGNTIGEYLLVFRALDLEPCHVRFHFSTDEHIQRVQDQLAPMKKQLTDMDYKKASAKRRRDECTSMLRSKLVPLQDVFRGEPKKDDVQTKIKELRDSVKEIQQKQTRPPCKKSNYPPPNVLQYIKGIVCELAFVGQPNLSRILSYYCQSKMGVALTQTTEQQRRVYSEKVGAYCEATLLPFSREGFDIHSGRKLPLELPRPPPNFPSTIEFAVNLLEFTPENEYLRGTLFWSVFNKTIVVEKLNHGQMYREHLTRAKKPCPTILTRDGHVIASDGLMDPRRKCPDNLSDLPFSFGELPVTQSSEFTSLTQKIEKLEDLDKSLDECQRESESLKQHEDQAKELRVILSPKVQELERQLRKLRSSSDGTEDGPEKKRRR